MSIYKDDEGRWHGYVSMVLKDNGRRVGGRSAGIAEPTSPPGSGSSSASVTPGLRLLPGDRARSRSGWTTGWQPSPRRSCVRPR